METETPKSKLPLILIQPLKQPKSFNSLFFNSSNTHPSILSLPAVQFLYLKVRVEVEDDALRRLRGCDDPATVLVRRVLQRVAGGGDVAGVAGI